LRKCSIGVESMDGDFAGDGRADVVAVREFVFYYAVRKSNTLFSTEVAFVVGIADGDASAAEDRVE
jgi:hypothetical protein